MRQHHVPVLLEEVINGLSLTAGMIIVDGTAGSGGHTVAMWERVKPDGAVLGIELDRESFENLQSSIKKKGITFLHGSYADVKEIVARQGFYEVDGMLFDLGLSSAELEMSGRGFTFLKDEPLDMRFNVDQSLTAAEIVNTYDKRGLAEILKEYGEEQFANQIADAIVHQRKQKRIITTHELVESILSGTPVSYQKHRIHPATKTFQALRIAVNDELANIKRGLGGGLEILKSGGRLAVISFHSLEDRIVKKFFREKASEGVLSIVTKKPIVSGPAERQNNPRSRSAKLRIAQKL